MREMQRVAHPISLQSPARVTAFVVLESPALRVMISPDPWSFVVLDNSGTPVLQESAGGEVNGPIGLGFQAGPDAPARRSKTGASRGLPGPDNENPPDSAGWWHVTRCSSERSRTEVAYRADVETNDPSGRGMSVSIELVDQSSISFSAWVNGESDDVEAIGQSYVARDGERFLGFGERSHTVSLERGVIENYVGEGPYQPHEYPFLEHTVPPWGVRQRLDATYFPVPWVLSTAGYGLSVDNDELSYFRIRTPSPDRWSVEVESCRLDYRLFLGLTPLEALGSYSATVGRQPAPEPWFFGPWFQTGHANHVPIEEERRQIALLREGGAPVSAAETHCRYLPLGEDRGHESEEAARTALFHSEGLSAVSYLNPLVGEEYHQAWQAAVARHALQVRADGQPYSFEAYAGGRVPPHTFEAQYDFTTSGSSSCVLEIAQRIADAGYDGWMEDFGEYTPLDARQSDGTTGTRAHNRYPTDYHSVAASVTAELEIAHGRRFARFVRSGWRGSAEVVPIVWGGDPTTSWGFDGLASAIAEGLSAGASGVAMWGSDIGGFFSTLDRLTPELLRRWIQFAALTPVMRTKSGGIEVPPYERPQIWDPDVLPTWRRWASLHTQLNDYLMEAHAAYRRTGRPIMAALELVCPDDPLVAGIQDEYLLGEDLLVAPVIEPGCTSRTVVVPAGRWIDLWSVVSFDDAARKLVMRGDRELTRFGGPSQIGVEVNEDEIPVFVRGGAVVSLLSSDVDTLSPYGETALIIAASERDDRRQLLAFPGDAWAGAIGPGQRARSELGPNVWTLEITSERRRTWELSALLAREPKGVDVVADGEQLAACEWSYQQSSGVLRCTLDGGSVRLSVEFDLLDPRDGHHDDLTEPFILGAG
jgi:sulfoquinovosidase